MSVNGRVNGLNPTQSGKGFLSFNSMPPRLHITAEDDEFDETTLQHWRDEGIETQKLLDYNGILTQLGFDVTYLPMNGGGKPYVATLKNLSNDLGMSIFIPYLCYEADRQVQRSEKSTV